jgi:hypothetical protein
LWVHDRSKCTPMSLHLKKPPEEQRGQEKVWLVSRWCASHDITFRWNVPQPLKGQGVWRTRENADKEQKKTESQSNENLIFTFAGFMVLLSIDRKERNLFALATREEMTRSCLMLLAQGGWSEEGFATRTTKLRRKQQR